MELSENELIQKLKRFQKKDARIIRGIGDDCAVVRMQESQYVFTQDALVEHIHFEFSFIDFFSLGKKALYVNVSDILSMGAEPLYFLVTMGIPSRILYKDIDKINRGMSYAAREFNINLIGGDTTETKKDFFIDIAMIGRLMQKKYLGRDTAKAGDLIGVTGYLGESAYGLKLLKESKRVKNSRRFIERYRNPKPPYNIWKELIKHGIPNAMMDISDGLLIDLGRMMRESKKTARIYMEHLPIPDVLIEGGNEMFALSGGEDYQFLFTFSPHKKSLLGKTHKKGLPVSIIGEVARGSGVTLIERGRKKKVAIQGYEHFRKHL